MDEVRPQLTPVDASSPAAPSLAALVAALSPTTGGAPLAGVCGWLDAAPASEANARQLLDLLEARAFDPLADPDGRPLRLRALEALLRMGYPWALHIAPEDLAWLRHAQRPFWRRHVKALAAATLWAGLVGWSAWQAWPHLLAWLVPG
jgi:hypothetical protein